MLVVSTFKVSDMVILGSSLKGMSLKHSATAAQEPLCLEEVRGYSTVGKSKECKMVQRRAIYFEYQVGAEVHYRNEDPENGLGSFQITIADLSESFQMIQSDQWPRKPALFPKFSLLCILI